MNYRHVLVARWSRRDWLAVLVVALVAALLAGTTLLIVTAEQETVSLAQSYDANATVSEYDSLAAARAAAGPGSVVLPTAAATNREGKTTRAVGLPAVTEPVAAVPLPPEEASGPVSGRTEWQIEGETAAMSITVTPGGDAGIVPESWVRVSSETIETIGATGALVIERSDDTGESGVPLVAVLAFFAGGTADVLGLLSVGVIVAVVVVSVTVSSVVRLLIADRRRTIRVARATGARPQRIVLPLAARAGLLTATGVALGYAIGVILSNAAVTVAVFLGSPTTLGLQITTPVVVILCGLFGALTIVGLLSGYVTARRGTAGPVARIGTHAPETQASGVDRLLTRLWTGSRPPLLAPRTIVPATATISAFVVLVLLVASLGSVGASIATDGTTITEPDAPHPVASQVPAGYAGALDEPGVAASPEILLFGYRDGEPYLARGADYGPFAAVTGAELVAGRAPTAVDEALVGTELADTLGLDLGDTLPMGGTTQPALAQVRIVGRYETGGIDDHQVLVSLQTAQHLATVPAGQVNVIRTNASIDLSGGGRSPVVLGVETPQFSPPTGTVRAAVTLWNPTDSAGERSIAATLAGNRTERTVRVPPRERSTVTLELPAPAAGEYELAAGPVRQPVTVSDTPPLDVSVPAQARPNSTVQVRVDDPRGGPVDNGTVSVGNRTARLGGDGVAWIQLPTTSGAYDLVVTTGERSAREPLRIASDARRAVIADATVTPDSPTVHARPRATVTLWNPWNETTAQRLAIEGPGVRLVDQQQLRPGERAELTVRPERRPPGEYTVRVLSGERTLTTATYHVEGDERLGASLASSGQYGSGGLGTAIQYAIGNLSVLLAVVLGLTTVTIVGALSAVLARAIRSKRRIVGVYRATGASPGQVLRLVALDALRIGAVSSLLALGVALAVTRALRDLGQFTAFGIALDPWPSALLAACVLAGGIVLTLAAALVVTIPVLRVPVRELLSGTATPGTSPAQSGTRQRAGRGDGQHSRSAHSDTPSR